MICNVRYLTYILKWHSILRHQVGVLDIFVVSMIVEPGAEYLYCQNYLSFCKANSICIESCINRFPQLIAQKLWLTSYSICIFRTAVLIKQCPRRFSSNEVCHMQSVYTFCPTVLYIEESKVEGFLPYLELQQFECKVELYMCRTASGKCILCYHLSCAVDTGIYRVYILLKVFGYCIINNIFLLNNDVSYLSDFTDQSSRGRGLQLQ